MRFFDAELLELARWVLDALRRAVWREVLSALSPPRVASEEATRPPAIRATVRIAADATPTRARSWQGYTDGSRLASAIGAGDAGAFVVRPAPEDEQALAVEAVRACLAGRPSGDRDRARGVARCRRR